MVSSVFYKLSLFLLGFNVSLLSRYALYTITRAHTLRRVPGPDAPSLLWGEEWELYHGPPGVRYIDWHKNFGKVVKFNGAFGHKILSITDPRAISFVLGEGAYSFPKPQGVRAWFQALLGEGILWVEGKKEHELQRRLLSPALNSQSVRQLTDIVFETSMKLADQWARTIDSNHGQETEIEVTNWAGRFALDTIGRAAFSYDFECLAGEPHELAESLDGLTNSEHKHSSFYMRALFWIFPAVLSIGKKGEMIKEVKHQLGVIASNMWKDAKTVCDTETEDKSLLAIMLRTAKSSTLSMSEEEIVSQMRTVISAGYETVSAIIAWVLYELAVNPDIQDKLREEICVIPDPCFDDFTNGLPLLDAILKETLRLHPAVLENHHEASETIVVPLSDRLSDDDSNQLIIPKGTLLVIPVNVLQTNAEVWGHNADLFLPSRWLDSDAKRAPGAGGGSLLKAPGLLAFSMG